jgi:ATP-dependent DNA helicase RecG
VGPTRAGVLAGAGYRTVLDLLHHLPLRYEDRSEVAAVSGIEAGGAYTLRGKLSRMRLLRTRRRGFSIVRGVLDDGTGTLPVVWFNRPYLPAQVLAGEEYVLHGTAREKDGELELLNPSCERAEQALHGARIMPVYPAAGSLGPAALRRVFATILGEMDLPAQVPEPLPDGLLARRGLPRLGEALRDLHASRGGSVAELNARQSPAHRRLVYGELLDLQLTLAFLRSLEAGEPRARSYGIDDRLRRVARKVLPFPLTGAQKRALKEIADDLRGERPMLRLLQGDVGSGKTIVAALALVIALENGYQGAFMAPTELLAEQHYAGLRRLLGDRYPIALFTKSSPEPRRLREGLAAGEIRLAVGTHALLQEGVDFRELGLAVVDEQHRFGVTQRALLRQKGERPDMLVMTATPIPRSLALAAYGDLPVSTLDELPPGRSPVATEVVPAGKRRDAYRRLREELARGGRAYVVFPLIEESDRVAAASVAEAGEGVRELFPEIPSAVLHGRMDAAERDRVMRAFAAGEVRLLIATTVIEVGVDVPEATWMVIESAERFGLAQLHQLRGRVGRGPEPSRCVALHGRLTEAAKRRLEVFAATTDGFAIAEADLAIRGPGDILGTRQAGLPALRLARLPEDWDWLERARDDARELLPRLAEPGMEALRARVLPFVAVAVDDARLGGG